MFISQSKLLFSVIHVREMPFPADAQIQLSTAASIAFTSSYTADSLIVILIINPKREAADRCVAPSYICASLYLQVFHFYAFSELFMYVTIPLGTWHRVLDLPPLLVTSPSFSITSFTLHQESTSFFMEEWQPNSCPPLIRDAFFYAADFLCRVNHRHYHFSIPFP